MWITTHKSERQCFQQQQTSADGLMICRHAVFCLHKQDIPQRSIRHVFVVSSRVLAVRIRKNTNSIHLYFTLHGCIRLVPIPYWRDVEVYSWAMPACTNQDSVGIINGSVEHSDLPHNIGCSCFLEVLHQLIGTICCNATLI